MFKYLRFVGVAVALTACTVMHGESTLTPQEQQYKTHIESSNPSLLARVSIAQLSSTNAGGLMMAQASLKNIWFDDIEIQYKFRWLDANGIEQSPEGSPWKPMVIRGGDLINVQSVAPNPAATQFKIVIDSM